MLKPILVVVKTDSKDQANMVGGGSHRLYSITILQVKEIPQTKLDVRPVSTIPIREFKTLLIRRRFITMNTYEGMQVENNTK